MRMWDEIRESEEGGQKLQRSNPTSPSMSYLIPPLSVDPPNQLLFSLDPNIGSDI